MMVIQLFETLCDVVCSAFSFELSTLRLCAFARDLFGSGLSGFRNS